MRYILVLAIALFAFSDLYAQDHRLSGLYSVEQIRKIEKENPQIIEYWDTYLNKGWLITVAKEENQLHGTMSASPEGFNPLDYQIFPSDETQYYQLEGTNLTLIVYPKDYLLHLYNKTK